MPFTFPTKTVAPKMDSIDAQAQPPKAEEPSTVPVPEQQNGISAADGTDGPPAKKAKLDEPANSNNEETANNGPRRLKGIAAIKPEYVRTD